MTGLALHRRVYARVSGFLRGDAAISITEYGMLVAFMALVIIAVVIITGGNLSSWFGSKTSQITTV